MTVHTQTHEDVQDVQVDHTPRCENKHCGKRVKLYRVGWQFFCWDCMARFDAMMREDARELHYDRTHIGL